MNGDVDRRSHKGNAVSGNIRRTQLYERTVNRRYRDDATRGGRQQPIWTFIELESEFLANKGEAGRSRGEAVRICTASFGLFGNPEPEDAIGNRRSGKLVLSYSKAASSEKAAGCRQEAITE
ncbi:hypothetical protein TgHK011_007797 [Trichoderma gracile]|nr:hypothetical protein TgHK011_007797 [Trichoderma gracile]